ncbi:MAG: putative Ig domain-containing protein [Candidatus Solibacter usitatus]|nr:putative Ig domain-containing protein [Candidatus Solibacter usitatus]
MRIQRAWWRLLGTIVIALVPAAAQFRLVKVSGDGQLAQLNYGFMRPLVVKAVDGAGNPVAGKSITWNDTGAGISYISPPVVTTGADGLATLQFVTSGSFGPGVPYLNYSITAASDIGSVSFSAVSFPTISGAFNPQPTVQLIAPAQGSPPLAVRSGGRLADAVRVIVVTGGGNGVSPGLPIPGAGLTVRTANQDPRLGPVVACTGGTPLTGQDGTATCELSASGLPGTVELTIDVGALITYTTQVTVTAGDPAPVIVQGNNQAGAPGQILPLSLAARVEDWQGTPMAGAPVVWSAVPPGSVNLLNTISTSNASGLVSTNVQLGPTPGQFQVRVAAGANQALFNVTIQGAAPALTITSATLPAGIINTAYSQALGATGGTQPYTWAVTSGALPPGLTLAANGTIAGTPSTPGTFSFTVRASDSVGAQATRQLSLTISGGLGIATPALPNGSVGSAYSQALAASGGSPPYTWSVVTGGLVAGLPPPGLTLSAAGVLSGIPTTTGVSSFNVRVVDSAARESFRNFTLTIGVGLLITTSPLLPNGAVGTQYSQTLSASGGAAPYSWTVTGGALPPGITLTGLGLVSGVPAAGGAFSFTARATDAVGATGTASFSLSITDSLRITTAAPLPDGAVGNAYSLTFAAAGGRAPYLWSITGGALPAGLSLSAQGILSGTPAGAGAAAVTVRVSDAAGANAAAAYSLTIAPPAAVPRAGVFAQVASGGGWKTTLSLINVGAGPATVRISLAADDGSALDLPLVVTQQGASVTLVGNSLERTLAPNAGLLVETEAAISATLAGWAEVRSTGPVSGYAIFRQRSGEGRESEGTSPLESRTAATVLVSYDNQAGFSTGVALVNLAAAPATVTAILRDDTGAELARDAFLLPASGHTAFSMPEKYPALLGRRGMVEFQSNQSGGLSALGLRFNPSLSFTSIPVAARPL